MKKFNVVAASAVALTAALASGSALAHGTLAVTSANYNAAAVAGAGGTITVPWGGTASGVYTVTPNASVNPAVATSLEVNSRFTVTLPSGFTFSSQPSLNVTGGVGGTAAAVFTNGGIGQQTATFTISGAPVGVGGQLALNQVAVSGATILETAGGKGQITVQSTNNAQVLNDDTAAVAPSNGTPAPFAFTSDTGVIATFANGGGNNIDLTPPSLGTLFNEGTDTATIDIGTIHLVTSGSLAADGIAATQLSSTDTANVTISGLFNGIKGVTATAGGVGGTVLAAGTVTGTTLSIPAIPANGAGQVAADIVITSAGTTLLQANTPVAGGFTAGYTPGASVTDFLGGSATDSTDAIPYAGGTPINVTNFLTGTDAGYQTLVRFSNGSSATNTLFAVAEPYTGGVPLVGSLGTIGAGIGTVFTEAAIQTATGLSLANSGQRATLTIIAIPGGQNVTASGLLVNPGGVVNNVN
jgi:hypothetical protein